MISRRVLGIDPGTARMGWAVLNQKSKIKNQNLGVASRRFSNSTNNLELIDCGVIESPAKTPLPDRLEIIYKELDKIAKKYKPNEMAIEELFFVKNVKTGISVAHARGVAILLGAQKAMNISEYKPNEIKLGICGFGHADKAQIMRMLKLHLKDCTINQDDTADAVAVALFHLQVSKIKSRQ